YCMVILLVCLLASVMVGAAQPSDTGRQTFVSRCAGWHGTDGHGGEPGPAITRRVAARTDADLASLLAQGLTASGMPAFPNLTRDESADVIQDLRTLARR